MSGALSEETAQELIRALSQVRRQMESLAPLMRHDERMQKKRAERRERLESVEEQIEGRHQSYLERMARQIEAGHRPGRQT